MPAHIDEVVQLVRVQLGTRHVTVNSAFAEDLRAESADILNLVATVEDRYGVSIREEELIEVRTVRDLHLLVQSRQGRAHA